MTNQASEDELKRELERLYKCVGYDIADGVDRKELWIKEIGVVVESLVRTEKLKLLDRLEKQATIVTSLSGEKTGTIDLTAIENERNKDV